MSLPAYEKLGAFYLGRVLDPHTGADTQELVLYDSRDLTTHAVCVGMTGSGKTGLGIGLIEEAAIDGVPALVIDPKGDLGNLLLTFPELRPEDFEPWIDPGEAARKGQSVGDYARSMADTWRKGLAEWQQDGERIARLRAAAEFVVYTPGHASGRGLSLLRSFAPPSDRADGAALQERIAAAVSGLLALLGIAGDALKSREHLLLSSLLEHAWRAGEAHDLASLIHAIQKPPFDKVGVFDLETFYPSKERLQLAMAINTLLAAPGFDAWLKGDPLDMQRLLFGESGKPRVAIVSIAHLSDAERMFVVTAVLNEMVAWMRKQSGTSSLRALVYMDEIFGYFPPSAMPPSKLPLLTLMKQARAFGVGVVLATQNPVDLDYKGLSNAGTWFVGRLQTERDQARVIDGLLSATGGALDKAQLEQLMAKLSARVFLVRNVHEDKPVLLRTRWTLSYLRGPMTLNDLQRLSPAIAPTHTATVQAAAKALIPAGVPEYFVPGTGAMYLPRVLATVRTHFVDDGANVDAWQTRVLLAPLSDDGSPDWSAAASDATLREQLMKQPDASLKFAEAPGALLRAQNYALWSKQAADHVYRTAECTLLRCALLKLSSNPDESESDFRARIALGLRERRDAEVDKLRAKYAARVTTLTDQIRRAEERVAREQSQLSQQKMHAAISVGSAILGALLGRKAVSASNIGRVGTAARSAGRISHESADVARASDTVEVLRQRLDELQAAIEAEVARVQSMFDHTNAPIETFSIKPRKSDTATTEIAVAWIPI